MKVTIYTDGSAGPTNPGRGTWAAIVSIEGTGTPQELFGEYKYTTNNRMEIMAAIRAIESLPEGRHEITVFSDSKYLVNGANEWVHGWVKKNFEGKLNPDLWKRYHGLHLRHKIIFKWVRGHNGDAMNERCDLLCEMAYNSLNCQIDEWFERQ